MKAVICSGVASGMAAAAVGFPADCQAHAGSVANRFHQVCNGEARAAWGFIAIAGRAAAPFTAFTAVSERNQFQLDRALNAELRLGDYSGTRLKMEQDAYTTVVRASCPACQ